MRTIAEELNIKLEGAVIMKKSEWERTVKDKVQNQMQEREVRTVKTENIKRRQLGKKWIHSNMW